MKVLPNDGKNKLHTPALANTNASFLCDVLIHLPSHVCHITLKTKQITSTQFNCRMCKLKYS